MPSRTASVDAFAALQQRLGPALEMNHATSTESHVMVVLPSFNIGASLLEHYAARLGPLEHRYLNVMLMLARIPSCELVFVTCEAPHEVVLDYYASLVPDELRQSVRDRFHVVTVDDHSPRAVADKLLERPDLLDEIRSLFDGRPAFIEPWNVTETEVEVAVRLDAPINGTAPDLWPLGFKSAGRRLFTSVHVPVPFGFEDIRTVDEAVHAVSAIRMAQPTAPGVVIKHDNSGAGDGNAVIALDDLTGGEGGEEEIGARVAALPDWFVADLAMGSVVEERIAGDDFSSPSVQVEIAPSGEVRVLATHDQVLAGEGAQVYMGCRFPADPSVAVTAGRYGRAIAERLAEQGVVGRLSVDFVAATQEGERELYAIEVNLRKGGTTHPYAALRNLATGHYDEAEGTWTTHEGETRAYAATDNLIDAEWKGLPESDVIEAVVDAGLQFDRDRGTGVVLHMLSCLAIDGRCGLTAIGRTRAEADDLYDATRDTIASLRS